MDEEEYKEENNYSEGDESTEISGQSEKAFLKKILIVLAIVLFIIGLSSYLTYILILKYPEKFGLLKGPGMIKKEEKALVSTISKSFTLPTDEEPTIATVTDPEKLSKQYFFKDAQKDDKLLIYQNAKKVILYRPSENRVIEAGVINVKQAEQLKATDKNGNYKMAILNSIKDESVISSLENKAKETESTIEVTDVEASTLSYNKSFIVDVKGNNKDMADKLASALSVKTGNLPDGEKKFDVDFILVIGQDKSSR